MDSPVKYPAWVRIGIWGISSRKMMQVFTWLAFVLFVAHISFALWKLLPADLPINGEILFWGCLFGLAFAHYFTSLKWVDRHGDWTHIQEQWANASLLILGILILLAILVSLAMMFNFIINL